MLVLRTLTVRVCEAAASALQINSLEGSLMIEWGMIRRLSGSIGLGMPSSSTLNLTARIW
jgi:hypothetical protein